MIASLLVGIAFTAWRLRKQGSVANPMAWLGAVAGSAFVGTSATTLYELLAAATQVPVGGEAAITLIFAIIPLALGLAALHLSIKKSQKASTRKRVSYVVLGAAALFIWAGLIIGPILAIAASIMPTGLKRKK